MQSPYYETYMQFPGAMVPNGSGGGVWSTNPVGGMTYEGGYAGEYMPYGSSGVTDGQYDYSAVNWFQSSGLDYSGGGATWAPKQQQLVPDYNSNGYYENSAATGGSGDVTLCAQTPWGGAGTGVGNTGLDADVVYSSATGEVEQDVRSLGRGFRQMRVSGENDEYASAKRSGGGSNAGQKKSWANIASQPARPIRPSLAPPQLSSVSSSGRKPAGAQTGAGRNLAQSAWTANNGGGTRENGGEEDGQWKSGVVAQKSSPPATGGAQYNPKDFDLTAKLARFFVIKSFSEDDIHRSIKYSIWCSTEYGNKRLDAAWQDRQGKGPVYLLFSVNGSGHFCGIAQMVSAVDYHSSSTVWAQDKWKGVFDVRWIYVKDVPNSQLRHIRLENNEGKPVTNSRDTQEVVPEKGRQVLRIMAQYRHTTSIFDDFQHYEQQLEGSTTAAATAAAAGAVNGTTGGRTENAAAANV